jgi:two-component sensor histidine kinase/tetratricopeptide (TPR) repeat protein
MKARWSFIFLWLTYLCLPVRVTAQGSADDSGLAHMIAAEAWRLKNDSTKANTEVRKGIAVYLKRGQIREAAEGWLTLENYYTFFHGEGYGPRIACYERALELFNSVHVKDRAFDTRRILGNFYMQSASVWKLKYDSAKCNTYIRKAIEIYTKNGQIRDAAETWLILESHYVYFEGRGYGPRIAYYKKALALFNQARITDRAAATLTILGDFYQEDGRYQEALAALNKSMALYRNSDKLDLQRLYSGLGNINAKLGNHEKALEYNLLGIKTAEIMRDTTLMVSKLLNNVGNTYMSISRFKQALDYYRRGLNVAKKKKAISSIILLTSNLALTLRFMNRSEEAYNLLQETQRIYHPTEVIDRVSINRVSLIVLMALKNYGAAKKHCDTLINLEPQLGPYDLHRISILRAVGAYYLAVKNYGSAQEYAAKFRRWGAARGDSSSLLSAAALQYKIDSAKGDHINEIKNYRQFISLRDRMFNETKAWQIAQLDIAYQTETKDRQIKAKESNINMLKKQAQLQAINIKQKETTQKLIIAGTVLLTLLLGLGYNRYRLKQRVNRQLQQQQTEINHQNVSLTNLIAEKDNLIDEKEWLMKEIHHRVKNNLQIVISLLNTQSSFLKDDLAYRAIRESQHRMQSISLIHQKLYQSDNLSLVDMPAYISDLVEYLISSFDIAGRIDFDLNIAPIQLDVNKSVPLGLILNESITNSIKYAFPDQRPGKITIRLSELEPAKYELMISDDGIGPPLSIDIAKSKTLGLNLMRGLAKQLSGTISFETDHGMTIHLSFNNIIT